jgi:hypothetical protein
MAAFQHGDGFVGDLSVVRLMRGDDLVANLPFLAGLSGHLHLEERLIVLEIVTAWAILAKVSEECLQTHLVLGADRPAPPEPRDPTLAHVVFKASGNQPAGQDRSNRDHRLGFLTDG